MKQHKLLTTISAIGLVAGTSQAAIVSFTDNFTPGAGQSLTASGNDDSAATSAQHSLSYNETNPSTSGGTTEIRTQDGPFNNG